jgi:hypothetical protein
MGEGHDEKYLSISISWLRTNLQVHFHISQTCSIELGDLVSNQFAQHNRDCD